jgi:transcriptional regulator with XRE-family HTH domain
MTPFSDYLFQLRRARGLRQQELADRLGLGSSYISALESCRKEPPTEKQLQRVIEVMALNADEAAELIRLAKLSRRRIDIPTEASKEEYVLAHELAAQLGSLTQNQIDMMRLFLRISGEDMPERMTAVQSCRRENIM